MNHELALTFKVGDRVKYHSQGFVLIRDGKTAAVVGFEHGYVLIDWDEPLEIGGKLMKQRNWMASPESLEHI